MKTITQSTFQEFISTNETGIIEFGATWCAACKKLEPMIDQLAENLAVAKIDIDEDPELVKQFNIKKVPTLLIFKYGILKTTQVGGCSIDELKKLLSE